jgi:glutamate-1-semialdehyde 2,1-aminomutase
MKDHGHLFKNMPDLTVAYGRDGRVFSEDGKDYVDFVCGFGPVFLGHGRREVVDAVCERLRAGILFAANSRCIENVCTELLKLVPGAQDCRLVKTGSEAVAVAARLARAFTARPDVVRCGFHGWHDEFVSPKVAWHDWNDVSLEGAREVIGVNRNRVARAWNGAHVTDLEKILREDGARVAALIIDPVQLREPVAENAYEIARVTRANGSILIFDETKTALRLIGGSAQAHLGQGGDLTVLGKAIGNGMPIAAVVGKQEIMRHADVVGLKGTYNTELASIAAAQVTLRLAREEAAAARVEILGRSLHDGLNSLFAKYQSKWRLTCVPYRWPCMPHIVGTVEHVLEFHRAIWEGGVLMIPRHMSFVSAAHTERDIEDALTRVQRALEAAE